MSGPARQGYLSRQYAESFSEFGTVLECPASGGWLLARDIPGTGLRDAMGLYPLFCCLDWERLGDDLDALGDSLVSVVMTTDPMAEVCEERLRRSFSLVRPYKAHFVIDARRAAKTFVSASHRAHARRALRQVAVERCAEPSAHLDDWERLFQVLAKRHAISGIRRLSRQAFARQLATPGMVMFRAVVDGRTVGLDLWYVQGDVAQGHLAAYDETGYALHAAYATKWTVIDQLSAEVRWLNLGAGRLADASDGLSAFKRGFATGTRPSWLAGSTPRGQDYATLSGGPHDPLNQAGYFPAYRKDELVRQPDGASAADRRPAATAP
jgi:hypothetical protein